MVSISPDWVQAIASILTLLVIIGLALYTTRLQKSHIDREEAYRVKPVLIIDLRTIQESAENMSQKTLWMDVGNLGRGDAFDLIIRVSHSKKTRKSVEVSFKRIPKGRQPDPFDTKIPLTELLENRDGEILLSAVCKDENEKEIEVKRSYRYFDFLKSKGY